MWAYLMYVPPFSTQKEESQGVINFQFYEKTFCYTKDRNFKYTEPKNILCDGGNKIKPNYTVFGTNTSKSRNTSQKESTYI